jgi:hypothetical protein
LSSNVNQLFSNTLCKDYLYPSLPVIDPIVSHNSCKLPVNSPQYLHNCTDILPDLSPIPQLDGIDPHVEHLHEHQQVLRPSHDHVVLGPSSSTGVEHVDRFARPLLHARKTSFSLDKKKQLKKLRKDTSLADYEIEVSPSSENVNIQCSTGFYTKIAKPALEHLAVGASASVGNVIQATR